MSRASYACVQATVVVGTVLIWDFGVAWYAARYERRPWSVDSSEKGGAQPLHDHLRGLGEATGRHQRLKHAAACRRMPQHLSSGPVGGGFEACRSMPQHTAQTKILIPSLSTCAVENDGTLVDRCSGCGIQVPDSISRAVNTMSYRQRQQRSRLTYCPPLFFLSCGVVL